MNARLMLNANNLKKLLTLTALTFMSMQSFANKNVLYILKDEKGQQQMLQVLPPHLSGNGYKIVDAQSGRTIKEVLPTRITSSPSEIQKAKDAQLLKKYSNVQDAVQAKERKSKSSEIVISALKSNLSRLEIEKNRLTKNSATLELNGQVVPKESKGLLADVDRQIAETKDAINVNSAEKNKIMAEFDLEISRLNVLQAEKQQ
jgi:hypothetical protein